MLTLGTCRRALWNYGSNVPYSTASMGDIAQFDSKLAQVCERFFTVGTFKSMWNRINLAVYDSRITIPRGFDTCRYIDAFCGGPIPIYSQFHRFAGFGVVVDPVFAQPTGLRLLDENAQTFRIPTGTYTLRVVGTEAADPGVTVTGGTDENGDEIFGSDNISITNGSSDGGHQYTGLPYIQKVATVGPVSLYSVDTTTSEATLIGNYAPGETVPEYRQYAIGCVASETDDPPIVSAICKLSFVPAITLADLVIPSNIGALKLGLMSIQFEDKVDMVNAALYMGPNRRQPNKPLGAIDLLDMELEELTMSEQPSLWVSPTFGAGGVVNVH